MPHIVEFISRTRNRFYARYFLSFPKQPSRFSFFFFFHDKDQLGKRQKKITRGERGKDMGESQSFAATELSSAIHGLSAISS